MTIRDVLVLAALSSLWGCADSVWIQGPANLSVGATLWTPSITVSLEDGAIYSRNGAESPPDTEP